MLLFFFYLYVAHRYLHVRTHSFPTRRSSDLGDRPANGIEAKLLAALLRNHERHHFGVCHRAGFRDHPVDSDRQHATDGKIGSATSELQSLMRISYAVFCLKKKKDKYKHVCK